MHGRRMLRSVATFCSYHSRVMMGDDLLREAWHNVLLEHGFHDGVRREALVQLLRRNMFTKLAQLRDADHPRTWVGASDCSGAELEALWGVRQRCRPRSRQVACFLTCVIGVAPSVAFQVQTKAKTVVATSHVRCGLVGSCPAT